SWQLMAKGLGNVSEMVVLGIFPWCFTPELYTSKPEYVESLGNFVRSRPAQGVEAFMQQSNAVIAHDVESSLSNIRVPSQISFGQRDVVTSTARFAEPLKSKIRGSELVIFEGCSHAPIYE